jgi:PRA1 family protein
MVESDNNNSGSGQVVNAVEAMAMAATAASALNSLVPGLTSSSGGGSTSQSNVAVAMGGAPVAAEQPSLLGGYTESLKERFVEWKEERRENLRPWNEFTDREKIAPPYNVQEVPSRLRANLEHFQTNYILVFFIALTVAVLFHPSLLFVGLAMGLLAVYLLSWRREPLLLCGWEVPLLAKQAVVIALSLLLCFLTGVTGLVLWTVGFALLVTLGHALCRVPHEEELFGPQPDQV